MERKERRGRTKVSTGATEERLMRQCHSMNHLLVSPGIHLSGLSSSCKAKVNPVRKARSIPDASTLGPDFWRLVLHALNWRHIAVPYGSQWWMVHRSEYHSSVIRTWMRVEWMELLKRSIRRTMQGDTSKVIQTLCPSVFVCWWHTWQLRWSALPSIESIAHGPTVSDKWRLGSWKVSIRGHSVSVSRRIDTFCPRR